MSKGFLTKRPIFTQLWSHHQGLRMQQRRLRKTQAELASSAELLKLLDEIEEPEGEEFISQDEETGLSQWLPLSPLMDPKLLSARERHRRPKQRPNRGNPSDLEKELLMNPYAQALASPLRYCGLTCARLPREFLLNFGFVNHPETGIPWHLPLIAGSSSQKSPPVTVIDNGSPKPRSNPTKQDFPSPPLAQALASEKPSSKLTTGIALPELHSDPHEKHSSPRPPKTSGSSKFQKGSYYLSSHSTMKLLNNAKKQLIFRTLPSRWRHDDEITGIYPVWRQDMHTFIQFWLQKHAFEMLKNCMNSHFSHIVKDSPDVPLELMSAALWLGKLEPPVPEDATSLNRKVAIGKDKKGGRIEKRHLHGSAKKKQSAGPPPYAMVLHPAGFYMPIYNLPVLLGAERLQELRNVPHVFGGETAYLRQLEKTVPVQQALWKGNGKDSLRKGEGCGGT